LKRHVLKKGPDAGKVVTVDQDVVHIDDPRITIEHVVPVVEH
jgi:hypothetical protein